MRRRLRGAINLACVAALWLSTGQARGDDAEERAKQLFFEAHQAKLHGDHATACDKFEQSLELFRRASTLLNLGECHEQLGKLATALRFWREGAALLESSDERMELAKQRVADLARRVPRVQLVLPAGLPDGAIVLVDGEAVPFSGARAALELDPGAHQVTLRVAGRRESILQLDVGEGQLRELTLQPGPPLAGPVSPLRPRPPERPNDSGLIPAGIAVGVTGLVGLIVGGVSGALVLDRKATVEEHCTPDDLCTDAAGVEAAAEGRTLAIVSSVAFAVGGAAAATGAVLLGVGLSESETPELSVRAVLLPERAAIAIEGRF